MATSTIPPPSNTDGTTTIISEKQNHTTPLVTVGGKERLIQAYTTLAPEFYTDAAFTYYACSIPDDEARQKAIQMLIKVMVKAALLERGQVIEAGGYGAVGILVGPRAKLDGTCTLFRSGAVAGAFKLGFGTLMRLLNYLPLVDRVKSTVLTPAEQAKTWYCFIIATSSSRRRQGLASAVLQEMQRRVALAEGSEGCIWLESSSMGSRRTYESQGFKVVGDKGEDGERTGMVLGKGLVGADGRMKDGGEGVVVWPMVWRTDGEATTKKGGAPGS